MTSAKGTDCSRMAGALCGILLCLLGGSVLLGWVIRSPALVQVLPQFAPMQPNTALGFCLGGCALICAARSRRTGARVCGAALMLLAVSTLMEYLFDSDLRIDRLLIEPFVTVKTSHPGRMSPITAICFALAGFGLSMVEPEKRSPRAEFIVTSLVSLILGIAATVFLSYLFGASVKDSWGGQVTQMAVHTAAGMLILGFGLITFICRLLRQEGLDRFRWLPIPVGMGVLAVTVATCVAIVSDQHAQARQALHSHTESMGSMISTAINERTRALNRMAKRWEVNHGTPREEWEIDAQNYVADLPGFQAIQWVDEKFYLKWCVPVQGNESVIGRNLAFEKRRLDAMTAARDKRGPSVSHLVDLLQGGTGFLIYNPIFLGNEFHGFIVGVIRTEALLTAIIPRDEITKNLIKLSEGNRTFYSSAPGSAGSGSDSANEAITPVQFGDVTWNLTVRSLGTEPDPLSDEAALAAGIVMALLLSGAVFLAQNSIRRSRELKAGNAQLAAEVSERKRIAARMRELVQLQTAILDSANYCIISATADGIISTYNPTAERWLGYTADEMVGKRTPELLHLPEEVVQYAGELSAELGRPIQPGFETFVARAAATGLDEREWTYVRKDGSRFPVLLSITALRDERGGITGYLGVASDITERKHYETALADARDAALESARLKAEFLANMSHEIRTPMNGVIGMTGLLLDTELTPKQRNFANIIRSSGESLLAVINDILDFSKIEAGKLTFETIDFNLRETVDETLELLAQRAQDKGIELLGWVAPAVPDRLKGDPGRLRQVLLNLLGNAIKFTELGEVVLRIEAQNETASALMLKVEVQDTGIGISPEAQKRLFQAFNQADGSTTRKYGGTGLGLAICKQLVEFMSGEIGVRSEPGRGSTFWFTAVLEKQTEPAEPPKRLTRDALEGVKVLIVDDSTTNREILENQTASWRMLHTSTSRGTAALEILRHAATAGDPFLLAIVDYQMPEMDGVELARLIKADPALVRTHVLMMTSLGQHLPAETLRETGIRECLFKPVTASRLLNSLIAAIGEKRKGDKPPASPPAPRPAPRKIKILLTEDNLVNRKVALAQLEQLGFTADCAANGREAVEALERIPYDVVLMDCHMPEMDGYEATREIRRRERGQPFAAARTAPVHIIAMTANALEGDREKCLAAGMDDYISKPVRPEALDDALGRWQREESARESTGDGPDSPPSRRISPTDPEIPLLVDFRSLKDFCGDDPVQIQRLITVFFGTSDTEQARLKAAIQARDADQIGFVAHKIRGASLVLGFIAVAGILGKMERQAISGNFEEMESLFAEYVSRMMQSRRVLEVVYKANPPG